MSADLLRRAAALMRERAEGAIPGPWTVGREGEVVTVKQYGTGPKYMDHLYVTCDSEGLTPSVNEAESAHIAGMHPTVALAIADWLDACALVVTAAPSATKAHAERVARAYLGEQP